MVLLDLMIPGKSGDEVYVNDKPIILYYDTFSNHNNWNIICAIVSIWTLFTIIIKNKENIAGIGVLFFIFLVGAGFEVARVSIIRKIPILMLMDLCAMTINNE